MLDWIVLKAEAEIRGSSMPLGQALFNSTRTFCLNLTNLLTPPAKKHHIVGRYHSYKTITRMEKCLENSEGITVTAFRGIKIDFH